MLEVEEIEFLLKLSFFGTIIFDSLFYLSCL